MTLFDQLGDVFSSLYKSELLLQTLSRPECLLATFLALNLIVFTETGLLVGCFLPGDSLLVTAGIVFHGLINVHGCSAWLLPLLLVTLSASAILGDSVGFGIGWRSGPRLFRRERSFFFRKEHLLAAQAYYDKHGGKTIILARFIPVLRTFAPVVAGIGRMNYRRFVLFNVFGGIGWVTSMVLFGFALPGLLAPPLRAVFGPEFRVEKHIEKVIVIVVLLSVAPGIVAWAKHKLFKKKSAPDPVKV